MSIQDKIKEFFNPIKVKYLYKYHHKKDDKECHHT